jgi:acyl dehydratase
MDEALVGITSNPLAVAWTSDDSILYALGLGLGTDDLEFTTENSEGIETRALPTMALVLGDYGAEVQARLSVDPADVVHGAESLTMHAPLPAYGALTTTTALTALFDKGVGAVAQFETTARLTDSNTPLFTKLTSAFIKGAGGWGGDRGPSNRWERPDVSPTLEAEVATNKSQALLYRLSGDRNPLHSDPNFAARAGFDRPILHGLCTFGISATQLLRGLCDMEPSSFRSIGGRFVSPVYPGETLHLSAWEVAPGTATFEVSIPGDRVVIDSGLFEFSPTATRFRAPPIAGSNLG